MTRFSRWRPILSVIQIPPGKNVQMKARLSNPIAEAKRLGANLATPEKPKIARERKIQTNPGGKDSNKTNLKCKQVKKINFWATLKIKWQLFSNFETLLSATFWEFIGNLWLSLIMEDRCKWHMRKC